MWQALGYIVGGRMCTAQLAGVYAKLHQFSLLELLLFPAFSSGFLPLVDGDHILWMIGFVVYVHSIPILKLHAHHED